MDAECVKLHLDQRRITAVSRKVQALVRVSARFYYLTFSFFIYMRTRFVDHLSVKQRECGC